MNTFKRCTAALGMLTFLAATPGHAAPLQPSANGTVTDTATGLVWMRCSVGQAWTGSTCTGEATRHNFDQANALTGTVAFAGQSDWRLPNAREWVSIINYTLNPTSVDPSAFPNTPINSEYWTSTSGDGNDPNYGWAWVASSGGAITSYVKTLDTSPVRLVRGGQPSALLSVARPSADYADGGNGTVLHTPTHLTWQRCMVGQAWNGSTCTGTSSALNWEQAKALTSNLAGQTDWRLPTVQELDSLMDYTQSTNTINRQVFPESAPVPVWSSTTAASANDTSFAWASNFQYGGLMASHKLNEAHGVRLVRATPAVQEGDELFAWAEAEYESLFPLPSQNGTFTTYTYRYYPNTGLVLAVQNRRVFGFGDVQTNRQMVDLTDAVCALNPVLRLCAAAPQR